MTEVPAAPPHAFTLGWAAEARHIDELGHVNNAVWVQWIQDVATAHWRARAPADDQDRWVWVVVRHEIDYLRPLLAGERVTARTWVPDAAKGARFDRLMRFDNDGGACCVAARTTWALIDRASGRPARVPPALIACFSAD